MILWKLNFHKEFDIYDEKFEIIKKIKISDIKKTEVLALFLYYINLGDYYFYKYPDKIIEAQEQYLKALKLSEKVKSDILLCESLRKILELYRSDYLLGNITAKDYINQYKEVAFDEVEKHYAIYFELILKFQHNNGENWNKYQAEDLLNYTNSSSNHYLNANIYQLIGSHYDDVNNKNKAIKLENKSLKELYEIKNNSNSTLIKRSLLAKARYFLEINNDSVLYILNKIDKNNKNRIEKSYKKYDYLYRSMFESNNSNNKEAYKNLVKYNLLLENEIKDKNENEFKELETTHQTIKKEKQILKQQQTATILTSTLLLGSIIAFLVYRNTKRKQRIAEQDRELQIQKTETILKEKELETINAMVSGQEKERLRLAGELHDNLGSTLATVRMQVENLERNLDKVDDPKALLQKTNALVNEAYDKVRSISHQRNSGVMAKDGLLPAVQKLARTVSSNNQLHLDVQDFGLENRIPNELEITIFRITQELVTNIIKHAQATEASISLTQHDNELNIMVEDNGKGFKVGKLQEKDGMGLGNIERRIEHLEGTMEVDSMPGRGTSVSIDIPL